MELLRVRFDEQARGERRKQASLALGSTAGTLKPWREVVTPHRDVASGRYQQAEFAADLWQAHLGEGTDEYRDPVEFFRRTGPALPSRVVGWRVPRRQTGLPVLRPSPSSTRAAAITPAEPVGALVARFPTSGSLPRVPGGSASASLVSRPAQRSLALQPAWSLSRPWRPVSIGVLQPMSLPPSSAPTATGWSDSCRAGFAPAEEWRLVTVHRNAPLSDPESFGDRGRRALSWSSSRPRSPTTGRGPGGRRRPLAKEPRCHSVVRDTPAERGDYCSSLHPRRFAGTSGDHGRDPRHLRRTGVPPHR